MRYVLLLTWCSPASRFAGGEAFRRLIGAMPPGCVMWCPVGDGGGRRTEGGGQRAEGGGKDGSRRGTESTEGGEAGCQWTTGTPRMHWRLRGGVVERFLRQTVWARRTARVISARLKSIGSSPQQIWLLAELDAVPVASELLRITGIPVHATVHDAWELAAQSGVPRCLMPLYNRQMRRALSACRSVDTVSVPLLDYVNRQAPEPRRKGFVLPPSLPAAWMCKAAPPRLADQPIRIGFCGTHRIGVAQWQAFADLLGALHERIELLVFGRLPSGAERVLPPKVSVAEQPYQPGEDAMIRALRAGGCQAGYVGLRVEPEQGLFARTSLSSKLVAYAAAGLPLIVDGPPDSVAWQLAESHRAGVLLQGGRTDRVAALRLALLDAHSQQAMAAGAVRLCKETFMLERNVVPLMRALGLEDVKLEGRG